MKKIDTADLSADFTGATQKFLKKHTKKWRGNND